MSTSPAGIGVDPQQKKGLNSNAPTYLRGDTFEEDQRRLLEAEYYRALNHYMVALDKKRRRKQQREVYASRPSVQHRPIGSPSNTKIDAAPEKTSNKTTNTDMVVLGMLDMGRLLEPAKLVALHMNMPAAGFEGKYIDSDANARRMERHNIERARDEYEKAQKAVADYHRKQSENRAREHLNIAAKAQYFGWGDGEEALEAAQKEMEGHAKQVLQLHKQSPGKPNDESFKALVESLSDMQLFGNDDSSVAEDLLNALSKEPDIGYMFEATKGNPETVKHIYVVKKNNPEKVMAIHTVVKGDTLSRLAQRYYGDMHAWQIILETNRSIIKDKDLIEPGWRINIPFKK
jgi:nucleoid-associated protein YgaU